MSHPLRLCACLCLAMLPLTPVAAQAINEPALAAFGGFEGLSRITNDFVGRVQKTRIGSFSRTPTPRAAGDARRSIL